jgi:hypothetical protein
MKRLLDEGPDDLTRALLEAGAKQRPPPVSRARVLVALGAGTSFGLLSAKALAWAGTQAGKWTLVGVALCSAGTLYAVLPSPAAEPAPAPAPAVIERPAADAPLDNLVPSPAPVPPASETTEPSPAGETEPPPARVDGPSQTRPAKARRPSARPVTAQSPVPEATPVLHSEPTDLDVEVRLVDQLRAATLRRDWSHAKQLVDRYQQAFPQGQLAREVRELAAPLSAHSH